MWRQKMKAVISEDYKGVPKIRFTGDTLEITFTIYSNDFNHYRELWEKETVFKVEENVKTT